MATQGIVTVRDKGSVVMKVVAGCNGQNAQKVAEVLQRFWPIDIEEAYKIARENGFGCTDCLVVITESDIKHCSGDEIPTRYRETFQQLEFNPRWDHGTAAYTLVIDI
jgi:hypothetical protein